MNSRFWMILFLLLIWCGFSNDFQFSNLLLGLVLSISINYLVMPRQLPYRVNILALINLMLFMLWELLRSSFEVAWDIITPTEKSDAKLIEIKLCSQHPIHVSLFTSLISLTPGTLAIDLSEDNQTMLVHVMFAQNTIKTVQDIKSKVESKIIRAFHYG